MCYGLIFHLHILVVVDKDDLAHFLLFFNMDLALMRH